MAITSSLPAPNENNSVTSETEGYINNGYVKDSTNNGDTSILSTSSTYNDKNANITVNSSKADETKEPVMDFDDLLPHIGEFGRYQKILFLCMIPFAFFVAFIYFSQIFITLVPEEHWCNVPELGDLSVEER